MSDVEDYMLNDWIPYSERSEWADLTPIAQDDGDYPVVAVMYSFKCK